MMPDHISGERRKQRQRSLGGYVVIAIAGLHEPTYRDKTHTKQTIKSGNQPFFPSLGQVGNGLASQVRHPMAHAGWRQGRRMPAACCYTESKQSTDCFFAATDAGEMGIGAGRHNTTTQGASVTLHVQAGNKTIKKTRGEPMPPDLVMIAVQARCRPYPWEILTLLKNVLEKNLNKIYHEVTFVVWGGTPKCKGAVSSRKLTAQLNLKTFLQTESR
jgi:hypothetical protein